MNFELLLAKQRFLQEDAGIIWGGEGDAIRNLDAAIVECVEAKNELNWKFWRLERKEYNKEKFTSELVDILQFWANACNAVGITSEDIQLAYNKNLDKAYERIQRKEMGQK